METFDIDQIFDDNDGPRVLPSPCIAVNPRGYCMVYKRDADGVLRGDGRKFDNVRLAELDVEAAGRPTFTFFDIKRRLDALPTGCIEYVGAMGRCVAGYGDRATFDTVRSFLDQGEPLSGYDLLSGWMPLWSQHLDKPGLSTWDK